MSSPTTSTTKSVVLITGAAGWLGGLLAKALLTDHETPNLHLILADVIPPRAPCDNAICLQADLTTQAGIDALFTTAHGVPDTIYAMHGIMSRGSEDDFDLGLKVSTADPRTVNVDSIRLLLDAARYRGSTLPTPIRFIFTSSLAVYGGQLPEVVTPDTIATPEGAYGTGKLTSELLINEYTRRGFIDGRILRLPTIVVRPGPPSNATSAFLSGIVREPLKGESTTCPIGSSPSDPAVDALHAWVASPPTTVRNLVRAKHVLASALRKHSRVICLPGFTASVRDILNALERVAGAPALARVSFADDPVNRAIVSSWPARFDNAYALSLGFVVDEGGMESAVRQFYEDVKAGIA
ncbi:hypothetical protein EW146_g1972 [Bondarzewia mesenterica]|uniref:NAD-dependent epimerase/dehydratase domain-containing protein n=1 Tax=Bondarzewia mesenterica TaxID=1095465 RepID=A0A4S4M283_9AGAM|nr:hypothetical protein EW146_g1972 [Bondarzewia mesenterica]